MSSKPDYLNLSQVLSLTGLTPRRIESKIGRGTFPIPHRLENSFAPVWKPDQIYPLLSGPGTKLSRTQVDRDLIGPTMVHRLTGYPLKTIITKTHKGQFPPFAIESPNITGRPFMIYRWRQSEVMAHLESSRPQIEAATLLTDLLTPYETECLTGETWVDIRRNSKKGNFPRSLNLSDLAQRWREGDLLEYLECRNKGIPYQSKEGNFVTLRQVLKIFTTSYPFLRKRIAKGTFPPPRYAFEIPPLWREADIDTFFAKTPRHTVDTTFPYHLIGDDIMKIYLIKCRGTLVLWKRQGKLPKSLRIGPGSFDLWLPHVVLQHLRDRRERFQRQTNGQTLVDSLLIFKTLGFQKHRDLIERVQDGTFPKPVPSTNKSKPPKWPRHDLLEFFKGLERPLYNWTPESPPSS